MIVDSSAVLAILFDEAGAEIYARAISGARACRMSAATLVEVAFVVDAHAKEGGGRQFDAFLRRSGIAIEPVTEEQAHVARQAYSDFGKGRHPARLNFGNCFSYALAKVASEPLLFKGKDFKKTDVLCAL